MCIDRKVVGLNCFYVGFKVESQPVASDLICLRVNKELILQNLYVRQISEMYTGNNG